MEKIALVTGSSRGIGRAIAKKFAVLGASVIVADLNLAGAEETGSLLSNPAGWAVLAAAVGNIHFIDENKEKKIQELKLPVLEIDISSLSTENLNRDILKSVLTNQIENKKWVYNPLWENAILWADNQYEIEIEKIKKGLKIN